MEDQRGGPVEELAGPEVVHQDAPSAAGVEQAGRVDPAIGVERPGREDVEIESGREEGAHVALEAARVARRILVGEYRHPHRASSLRPGYQVSR